MPRIQLHTTIHAPVATVFDLSRSIDLHIESTKHTGEQAIAGKTSGLIGLNETVTWRAKHLGIRQNLTSKITVFEPPHLFVDEMVHGAFKNFRHEHRFETIDASTTLMTDVFEFESPLGILGRLANLIFLERYTTKLLTVRNAVIKQAAEGIHYQSPNQKNLLILHSINRWNQTDIGGIIKWNQQSNGVS